MSRPLAAVFLRAAVSAVLLVAFVPAAALAAVPHISGFVPASGPIGTVVGITGTDFTGATSVTFNNTSAAFTVNNAGSITATVAPGTTSGILAVTTPAGTGTTVSVFTVIPAPTITGFTPASGGSGTSVTITGTNLGEVWAVRFNGMNAISFASLSDSSATAVVPPTTTGPISVTTPGGTVTSASDFTMLLSPGITGFTPASGPVGTVVTITGTNLSDATSVKFGETSAAFTVDSVSSITATVPAGASSGAISVTTPGGTVTTVSTFTVVPAPTITGFTPASGPVGTVVTITGTNLSDATSVKFGAASAAFAVNGASSITATVPAGASSGTISVTTPDGTVTSADPFTVTRSADVAVTITGPAAVYRGGNAVYTIVVTNNGPDAAESVTLTNTTPSGLTFTSNAGACTTSFPCATGTVASGATRTITATYSVPADYAGASPFSNTVSVSSTTPDPASANNSASSASNVTIAADLGITITGPYYALRGGDLVFATVVTNGGPGTASAVVVDATGPELVFVSNTGACTTDFPCALGALASGASATITTTVQVPVDYNPTPIVVSAEVTSGTADPSSVNNSSTATSRFGSFFTLSPCRLVDTRSTSAPNGPPALAGGEVRTFTFAGTCGIPLGATALAVNVTVTGATAPGWVQIYPAGVSTPPVVSTVNFTVGITRANNAIVVGSADGQVVIRVLNASSAAMHVVVDVTGYFE